MADTSACRAGLNSVIHRSSTVMVAPSSAKREGLPAMPWPLPMAMGWVS
jgi:hypothetical protein